MVSTALVAVLLISWVNYKSELIHNVDEICIHKKTTSEKLSQEECNLSCDPTLQKDGITDTKLKHCKLLNGSLLLETQNNVGWGDTMSQGSVWYTNDVQ